VNVAKSECNITLPADALGRAFGIEASHIPKIRSKASKTPTPPDRPPALNEDEITTIVAFVKSGHSSRNYVSHRDVLRFLETNYQKCLTYQWMDLFLKAHGDLVCRGVVCPQENVRLQVPREYFERDIRLIKECPPLVPTELLFNIDESGFGDSKARKLKSVLIPTGVQRTTLHYPACRKIRHHTLIRCVTAAGDAYCPLLISAQAAARDVFQHEIRDGIDLHIEIAPSPDVTSKIFARSIDTVLIPAVQANQELRDCTKKPAILFYNNCSAYISEAMLWNAARHKVLIITYPSHTSHVFQVLDVLLFGVVKRSKNTKCVMMGSPHV
jgi:hypothetical protein